MGSRKFIERTVHPSLLCVGIFAALLSGFTGEVRAQGLTLTWSGTASGVPGNGWTANNGQNWGLADQGTGFPSYFTGTTDLVYGSATGKLPNTYLGNNARQIRSLSFSSNAASSVNIGLTNNAGTGTSNLVFLSGVDATSVTTGTASIVVNSGATGTFAIGTIVGGTSGTTPGSPPGNGIVVLASSLNVIHNGSGTFTIGRSVSGSVASNYDTTFNTNWYTGSYTANPSLFKSGTGTLLLTAVNTYTGTTQINAGTLVLGTAASIASSQSVVVGTAAGSSARLKIDSSAYTFGGSQTLMGSGTVAGSGGTITIGGRLAPGNSPGLLTFDNTSLALSSTANTVMEITGSTRGTQYDAVNITGSSLGGGLTYGGTMTLLITQQFTTGGTFNLFQYETGEVSGSFAAIVVDPLSNFYTGLTWTNSGTGVWKTGTVSGTSMEFRQSVAGPSGVSFGQLVIVPEPVMLGLLGLAGGATYVGFGRIRRRRGGG